MEKCLLFTATFYREINPMQNLFYMPKVQFKSPSPQIRSPVIMAEECFILTCAVKQQ